MTDTPDTSRAALEVLAERLEAVDHMSIEDCFLQSPLYWRAASALRALAARVIELEGERDALCLAGKHLALKLAEFYRMGRVSPSECQAMREWMALMPARALAAKLKGEG